MRAKLLICFIFATSLAYSQGPPVLTKPLTTPRIKFATDGRFADSSYPGYSWYPHNDTSIFDMNGKRARILFGNKFINWENPGNLQVMGYDSAAGYWHPITKGVDTGGGGGGGAVYLNDLLSPTGATAFSMGANTLSMSFGERTSPAAFSLTNTDAVTNNIPLFGIFSNTGNHRLLQLTHGAHSIIGAWDGINLRLSANGANAIIDATTFRGNYPLLAADLPGTVAFTNAANSFSLPQNITVSSASQALLVQNSGAGSSAIGLSAISVNGDAIRGATVGVSSYGLYGQGFTGVGVRGHATSSSGTGGYFSGVAGGIALVADIAGSQRFIVNSAGVTLNTLTTLNLGNSIYLKDATNASTTSIRNTGSGGNVEFVSDPTGSPVTLGRFTANGLSVDHITSMAGLGVKYGDHILPEVAGTVDVGSAALPFRHGYFVDNPIGDNTGFVNMPAGQDSITVNIPGLSVTSITGAKVEEPDPDVVPNSYCKGWGATDYLIIKIGETFPKQARIVYHYKK